jgi:hypothetical protein
VFVVTDCIGADLERLDRVDPVAVVAAEPHGRDLALAGEPVDV